MGLKEVIAAVNAMRRDGVVERYAVRGAVGATFDVGPIATVARHGLTEKWRRLEPLLRGDTP
jgi:hypothetical protein